MSDEQEGKRKDITYYMWMQHGICLGIIIMLGLMLVILYGIHRDIHNIYVLWGQMSKPEGGQ